MERMSVELIEHHTNKKTHDFNIVRFALWTESIGLVHQLFG